MSKKQVGSMSDKGLYPMRKWHGKEYNIFLLPDGTYEGRIFDQYRRVYAKTRSTPEVEKSIKVTRWACEEIAKGQFGCYTIVDEGKAIRVKEEKEYLKFKKEMRKVNRGRLSDNKEE